MLRLFRHAATLANIIAVSVKANRLGGLKRPDARSTICRLQVPRGVRWKRWLPNRPGREIARLAKQERILVHSFTRTIENASPATGGARDWTAFLGRIVLALTFILSGLTKLAAIDGTIVYIRRWASLSPRLLSPPRSPLRSAAVSRSFSEKHRDGRRSFIRWGTSRPGPQFVCPGPLPLGAASPIAPPGMKMSWWENVREPPRARPVCHA